MTLTIWVETAEIEHVCTDSNKPTFVSYLDLRDIAAGVEKNLEDVYNKYREAYQ